MPGQLHDTAPAQGNISRSDAGAVRLGRRDIDGLIFAPSTTAHPTTCSPPAQAHHASLHDQRTTTQAQLDELAAATTPDQGPTLLNELPHLTGQLHHAPAGLLDALDIQILYRPEQHQATIWATLTDTTPATITALPNDPRIAASQATPDQAAPPTISELAQGPIGAETARDHETAWREGARLIPGIGS